MDLQLFGYVYAVMEESEDVFGKALLDFYCNRQKGDLLVHTTYGSPEKVPVEGYFYGINDFSELELIALNKCYGKILDIGAGTGKHGIALSNKEVVAIDISKNCVELMQLRGVEKVMQGNIIKYNQTKYDTLLLLQNGIGLVGSLDKLLFYLNHFKSIMNKGGQVIFDSSDISYLYDENEIEKPKDNYYGEMIYKYEYGGSQTNLFKWLYIDFELLGKIVANHGWIVEKLYEDEFNQYLVKLTLC